jgi:hypothetical protein
MHTIWSEVELEFVRANSRTMLDRDMASFLTRTTGRDITTPAVRRQRQLMGIRKKKGWVVKKSKRVRRG